MVRKMGKQPMAGQAGKCETQERRTRGDPEEGRWERKPASDMPPQASQAVPDDSPAPHRE